MIVLPVIAMRNLMAEIVGTTHMLTNESGSREIIGTIEEKTLRMAALLAISVVTGQTVWPADQEIVVDSGSERRVGVFRFKNG